MEPLYDYIHQGGCYRYGVGWARIRIYPGHVAGDAPVVLCSELPEDRGDEMVERLAAEVIRDRFSSGLPDLPRPVLWIEHRPSRRGRGPGRYALLTFPTYRPQLIGAGFVRRITLGAPRREHLTLREVEVLTGGG
ncbi:MAG: hypothetical protein LC751_16765 [Actinobacteria bacterium]|nr:hypothetical protein [Actinomycetota bacterium]MCA1739619.1 hypothetical protein [Actinomycetota bacterium]